MEPNSHDNTQLIRAVAYPKKKIRKLNRNSNVQTGAIRMRGWSLILHFGDGKSGHSWIYTGC